MALLVRRRCTAFVFAEEFWTSLIAHLVLLAEVTQAAIGFPNRVRSPGACVSKMMQNVGAHVGLSSLSVFAGAWDVTIVRHRVELADRGAVTAVNWRYTSVGHFSDGWIGVRDC